MNWVLLRGLGRESAHWLGFDKKIASGDDEVLCLDLPGVGSERHVESPTRIDLITDYIRKQFLEKRHSENPWGILALSLGGMIAMDWLKRYPKDFARGVIINSSAKDLSPAYQRFSPFAWYCLTQAFLKKDPRQREIQILKMISNTMSGDQIVLNKFCEITNARPVSFTTLSRQILAAARFNSPTTIKAPILILASNKDHMVNTQCSRSLAKKLHAPIKFHTTAGHDLVLDDPNWVIERVFEWC